MGSAFGRPSELSRSASQTTSDLCFSPSKLNPPKATFSVTSRKSTERSPSHVVKEIEKLRKKREERRARQNEVLLEKQELMTRDVGNPNWEFSVMVQDYRHSLEFQPLQSSHERLPTNKIRVCLRKRPLNSKEMSRKDVDVVTAPNKNTIIIHEPKFKVDLTKFLDNHKYRFDFVFNETSTNKMVYNYTAKSLVQTIFEGGMATCFAYGQTGSGKTHTMGGDFIGNIQDHSKGIYALTAGDVFMLQNSSKYKNLNLAVSASFFEIYCGKVFDLLNDNAKLRILENGSQQVQVVGLVEQAVDSVAQILEVIAQGSKSRSTSLSSCNDHSSRSHAVFQIILRKKDNRNIHGKFSLIDLAGNERGAADTTCSNHKRRIEGSEINKSLLALKECVRALGRKGSYLPFRASKLTQVLRDSFIGDNIATCMIAMISPGMSSCEQTLNTLRYANRVKELCVDEIELKAKPVASAEPNTVTKSSSCEQDRWRSINNSELSIDMHKFHQTVSHLQKLEEDVVENHKVLLQNWELLLAPNIVLLAFNALSRDPCSPFDDTIKYLKTSPLTSPQAVESEATDQWLQMDQQLIRMTENAGYNIDVYSDQLQSLVREKITTLNKFMETIIRLRREITGEENKIKAVRKPSSIRFQA
uniref:Kinesin-like protein n=1 Tax=Strigamia maritima TaxID=126957 RepID=T1J371_STRMM